MADLPTIAPATAPVFDTTAIAGTDTFWNGLRITPAGAIKCAVLAGGQQLPGQNGMTFSATGQLIILNTTAGLPANSSIANGLPFSPSGELCVSTGAAQSVSQGIPFAANGSVQGSII